MERSPFVLVINLKSSHQDLCYERQTYFLALKLKQSKSSVPSISKDVLASGITSIATPTYLSEIASPSVRGMLGSCFQLMVTIGVLYVGIIGAFLSWQWLSVACLALTLIWGLLMSTCPESPVYLW